VFLLLLALAVIGAILVARLPRGGGRALAAGVAVLALAGAALVRLRAESHPGRRWRSPS
jgi:hypothetical protein